MNLSLLLPWALMLGLLVNAVFSTSVSHHKRRHHRKDRRNNELFRTQNDGPTAVRSQNDIPKRRSAEIPPGATLAPNDTLERYFRSNCSSCIRREEAKWARVEQIKAELLQKLGLNEPPTANAKRDIPNFGREGSPFNEILQTYGYQSDSPGGVYNLNADQQDVVARTERIYSFARNRKFNFKL